MHTSERVAALLVVALVAIGAGCQRASPSARPAGTKARLAPNPFARIDPGDYPAPTPVATVARAGTIPRSVAQPVGEGASNKAAEIRVESYQTASTINGRAARPGQQFVVLATTWKNIIPLTAVDHRQPDRTQGAGSLGFGVAKTEPSGSGSQPATLESTPYVVPDVARHLWLLSDGRFADPVDIEATSATPGHLPTPSFTVAKLGEVMAGKLVFEAPADARYQALRFLDTQYGHVQIRLRGTNAPAPPAGTGSSNRTDLLEMAITEASWAPTDPAPPPGLRHFTLGLRGSSLSPKDIVEVKINEYVFMQNDQGCVAQPEKAAPWLSRPLAAIAPFLPNTPNEGQLAFLVPADTKGVKFLLRPATGGALDLAVGANVTPTWPTPVKTVQDGTTLRLHLLPPPGRPAVIPPPSAGHDQVLLDVVVENLKPTRGIEFQPDQQMRLVDADGRFHQPDPVSLQVPCRLTGAGVIPAGGSRRFMLVYDVPAGQGGRLQYRGFEKAETIALK